VPDAAFEVVELRRYVVHPDQRDAFVALFDREFTDSQEACGMVPIGHFRDRDDPRGFVWFRGFAQFAARRRALEAFYRESPAWKEHRAQANGALVDNDDVLLLRDARPGSGFDLTSLARPAGAHAATQRFVGVAVFMLERPAGDAFITAFEDALLPRLREHAQHVAYLVTDSRANEFPALPVREGEWAFVVGGVCADDDALAAWSDIFESNVPAPMQAEIRSCEVLRLEPAPRSVYGNAVAAAVVAAPAAR
jgi:hypothetical protein